MRRNWPNFTWNHNDECFQESRNETLLVLFCIVCHVRPTESTPLSDWSRESRKPFSYSFALLTWFNFPSHRTTYQNNVVSNHRHQWSASVAVCYISLALTFLPVRASSYNNTIIVFTQSARTFNKSNSEALNALFRNFLFPRCLLQLTFESSGWMSVPWKEKSSTHGGALGYLSYVYLINRRGVATYTYNT